MAVQKRGHIKIARKAFAEDKWWLEKRVFSKWEAWEDMIQLAQHEPREFVSTKFGTIRLERGEFVLSLRRMAERWGWGLQSTRSFTRSATFRTRLATQRETQAGTVYRIVNYDLYQSTEEKPTQPATQQITHDQHTSNTPVTQEQALKQLTTTTPAKDRGWVGRFLEAYTTATKGSYSAGRLGRELKDLIRDNGENPAFKAWTTFLASPDRRFGPSYFAKNYVDYSESKAPTNGRRPGESASEYQFRKRGYLELGKL